VSIEARIEFNKPLKSLSTFGIGGNARYFISIQTVAEMQELRFFLNRESMPYWVVGKGSNSLFDDRGFNGMIILNKIDFLEFDEGMLHVGAGYSFSLLGAQIARKKWSGLEFASGIPGSVGGAIYMNAGANGKETCDTLTHVGVIDKSGKHIEMVDPAFSYRTSPFQSSEDIIVSGRFQLIKYEQARKDQLEIIEYRMRTQPYGEKSAGCIFRNPDAVGAGALIEECGLKGKSCGGASVSTKHANFIINEGSASAADIEKLIKEVGAIVEQKTGVRLIPEVCIIGRS